MHEADEDTRPGGQSPRPPSRTGNADRHVGSRILERRLVLGLTQQQLAQRIGVSYQQARKYESGVNRISAGRLYEIAQVLNVPISWFFEGLAQGAESPDLSPRQRMSLELMRNFAAIENEKDQKALSHLARTLAAQVDPEPADDVAGGETGPDDDA